MSDRFRPSLTKAELSAIKDRRDAADIPALLWDIARLRAVALRADQFLHGLGPKYGANMVAQLLREELDQLACIQEMEALRVDIERRKPKEE
jgi:hypothetical protein